MQSREGTPEAEKSEAEGEKSPTPEEADPTPDREEPEPPAPTPPETTSPTPQPVPQPEPQLDVAPESEIQAAPSPKPDEPPTPAPAPVVKEEREVDSLQETTADLISESSRVHEITPISDTEMESLNLVVESSSEQTPSSRPSSPVIPLTPSVSRVERSTGGAGLETSTEGEPSGMFERFDMDVSFGSREMVLNFGTYHSS